MTVVDATKIHNDLYEITERLQSDLDQLNEFLRTKRDSHPSSSHLRELADEIDRMTAELYVFNQAMRLFNDKGGPIEGFPWVVRATLMNIRARTPAAEVAAYHEALNHLAAMLSYS